MGMYLDAFYLLEQAWWTPNLGAPQHVKLPCGIHFWASTCAGGGIFWIRLGILHATWGQ